MPAVRRNLPTVLLALSLPAGLVGYLLGARLVAAVAPGSTLVELFVPLFIAGLCMMPFLVPWLDRRAKADLAAIRALREEGSDGSRPGGLPRTDEPASLADRDKRGWRDRGGDDRDDDGDPAAPGDQPG